MAATQLNHKGQVFLPDFTASIVLFSLFLIIFGAIWNSSIQQFSNEDRTDEIQHEYTFNILKTNGKPQKWNSSNIEIPGMYTNNYIDQEKIISFKNLEVGRQRKILKSQEFYLELKYLNGSTPSYKNQKLKVFSDSGAQDSSPVPKNAEVYASRSIGLLEKNSKRVEMRFYTWG